jgi:hypothetical protein
MGVELEDEFALGDRKKLVSLKGRANFLYITFGLFIAVVLFRSVLYLMGYFYLSGDIGDIELETRNAFETWFEITVYLYLIFWGLCIVSFCVWVFSANKNLYRFGLRYVNNSPAMSTIANFIPVANLWMPFLVMSEIGKGTNAITGKVEPEYWKNSSTGPFIPWWWISRLAGLVLFIIGASLRSAGEENYDQGLYNDGTLVIILSTVVICASAILLIRVVNDITKKQELQSDFIQ